MDDAPTRPAFLAGFLSVDVSKVGIPVSSRRHFSLKRSRHL